MKMISMRTLLNALTLLLGTFSTLNTFQLTHPGSTIHDLAPRFLNAVRFNNALTGKILLKNVLNKKPSAKDMLTFLTHQDETGTTTLLYAARNHCQSVMALSLEVAHKATLSHENLISLLLSHNAHEPRQSFMQAMIHHCPVSTIEKIMKLCVKGSMSKQNIEQLFMHCQDNQPSETLLMTTLKSTNAHKNKILQALLTMARHCEINTHTILCHPNTAHRTVYNQAIEAIDNDPTNPENKRALRCLLIHSSYAKNPHSPFKRSRAC